MKTTKQTLRAISTHAANLGFPTSQIELCGDRLSLWIGDDDEVWNEVDDTYTSLVDTIVTSILSTFPAFTATGNGSKFDIVIPASGSFGDYNDVSSVWHY